MVRCSTFGLVLAWTAASVLAVGPEAFARGAHSYTAAAPSPYDLVLEVRGGNETVAAAVRVTLDSQLKVGQFKFSHQDLVVPVSGIPLAVIRTYDSFDTEARDFGIGWSYSIVDVEMEIDETRAIEASYRSVRRFRSGTHATLPIRNACTGGATVRLPACPHLVAIQPSARRGRLVRPRIPGSPANSLPMPGAPER